MPQEGSFLKAYFLGTQEEIEAYQSNASKPRTQREFNAAFVASGVLGLLGLPYTFPLVADAVARAGVAYAKKDANVFSKKGIREAAIMKRLSF